MKPGMTNEDVRQKGKMDAPFHPNENFLKAYQNRYSGRDSKDVKENPKRYRVVTTVLNMPSDVDTDSE